MSLCPCLSAKCTARTGNQRAGQKEKHRPGNLTTQQPNNPTTHRPTDVAFSWISLAVSASFSVTEADSTIPTPQTRLPIPESIFRSPYSVVRSTDMSSAPTSGIGQTTLCLHLRVTQIKNRIKKMEGGMHTKVKLSSCHIRRSLFYTQKKYLASI